MADTTYIVLRSIPSDPTEKGDTFSPVGSYMASDAVSAIKAAVATQNPADGAYVAVPMRSWKPVQVEAVQTTVLKLS